MSNINVVDAKTVYCDHGTHDKVYSVQILEENGNYKVAAQWGPRVKVVAQNFAGEKIYYDGRSKGLAQSEFNRLLNSKIYKKKKEDCYDQTIPTIIPAKYANGVMPTLLSKEETARLAETAQGLYDFLSADITDEPVLDGLDALLASF